MTGIDRDLIAVSHGTPIARNTAGKIAPSRR